MMLSSSTSSSSFSSSLSLKQYNISRFDGRKESYPKWRKTVIMCMKLRRQAHHLTTPLPPALIPITKNRPSFGILTRRDDDDDVDDDDDDTKAVVEPAHVTKRKAKADANATQSAQNEQIEHDYLESFVLIYSSLSDDVAHLVDHILEGDTYKLWSFLEKKYMANTLDNQMVLRDQFRACKLGPTEDIETYISRLNRLRFTLDDSQGYSTPENEYMYQL